MEKSKVARSLVFLGSLLALNGCLENSVSPSKNAGVIAEEPTELQPIGNNPETISDLPLPGVITPVPTPIPPPPIAPALNTKVLSTYTLQSMETIFSGFNIYAAHVMPYGPGVRIWYHGQQTRPSGAVQDQLYTRYGTLSGATSAWTSYASILQPSGIPGANAEHIGDPSVSVVKDPITLTSHFVMFFTVCVNRCTSINNDNQIWSATSLDGVTWGDFKTLIGGLGNPGGPKGPYAAEPHAVLDSSLGTDQMWMVYYPDPNTYSINAIPVDKNRNIMRSVGGKTFPKAVYKDATYVSAVEVHKFGDRYYLLATRNSVKPDYAAGSTAYPYSHFDAIIAESNDPLNFGENTANPLLSFAADGVNCGALAPTIHKLSESQFDIYFLLLSRRGGDCLLYDSRVAERPMLRWRFNVGRINP